MWGRGGSGGDSRFLWNKLQYEAREWVGVVVAGYQIDLKKFLEGGKARVKPGMPRLGT